ncbi:hypothetical protein F3P66_06780 [Agrobacterium fabrum]|nr:hypothetical protein F3P66_06780 [Agrobacterium fabrum]TRB27090.1 hypothetical protein EXN51_21665 [Agrobacterium fabrum]
MPSFLTVDFKSSAPRLLAHASGLENRTLTCLDDLPLPSKHLTVA